MRKSHLAKVFQPFFEAWLWNYSGMFVDLLEFLTKQNVPDRYKISTFQKLLRLHAENRFKQLKLELEKINMVYLSFISEDNPRPYVRDQILDSWIDMRSISHDEFQTFERLISKSGNPNFVNVDSETLRNRVYELLIRDEAYLLAMMAKLFPWISEIDSRIETLVFAEHAPTLVTNNKQVTRDELQKKYEQLNSSLKENDGLGTLLDEFHFPARSWKNRWRRPY